MPFHSGLDILFDIKMSPDTRKERILLTRTGLPTGQKMSRSAGALPLSMQNQAVTRLRYLSLLFCIAQSSLWLGVNLIEGQLIDELQRLRDTIPAGILIISSLTVYLLTRSGRLPASTLGTIGLIYQVLASYCLAFLTRFEFEN